MFKYTCWMDKCSREGTYNLLKGRLCQSESFPSASCVTVGKSLYNKHNLKILGITVIYSPLLINMTYSFRSNQRNRNRNCLYSTISGLQKCQLHMVRPNKTSVFEITHMLNGTIFPICFQFWGTAFLILFLFLLVHVQMLREDFRNKPDVGTVKIQFYSQSKMILHHYFLIGRMILLHLKAPGRCSPWAVFWFLWNT